MDPDEGLGAPGTYTVCWPSDEGNTGRPAGCACRAPDIRRRTALRSWTPSRCRRRPRPRHRDRSGSRVRGSAARAQTAKEVAARRTGGGFLPEGRRDGGVVGLAADMRHVEKLGEELHVSIRRFRERLAQPALQFDVCRQQPGVRKDDENVLVLHGRRGRDAHQSERGKEHAGTCCRSHASILCENVSCREADRFGIRRKNGGECSIARLDAGQRSWPGAPPDPAVDQARRARDAEEKHEPANPWPRRRP